MSEAFWNQFWPEAFVAMAVFAFMMVIGSESKHWVESIFAGRIKARTDQINAEIKLEEAKVKRISTEQEAADRAYLRALGDTDTIKSRLSKKS